MFHLNNEFAGFSYEELIGMDNVKGRLNCKLVRVQVNKNSEEANRLKMSSYNCLNSHLISSVSLRSLGKGYWCFLFETAEKDLSGFVWRKLDDTQQLIRQMLEAFHFLSKQTFVTTNVTPGGFLLVQNYHKVTLKIDIFYCVKEREAGGVTYGTNCLDLAKFLERYNYCLPGRYAYRPELSGLISTLRANGRVTSLVNHPFLWNSERRLLFLQNVYEASAQDDELDPETLYSDIEGIDIVPYVGSYYGSLPPFVCKDLSLCQWGLYDASAFYFLKGVRIFIVHRLHNPHEVIHGLADYSVYGNDVVKAFDTYLAFVVPNLFMQLYNVSSVRLAAEKSFERFFVHWFDVNSSPALHPVPVPHKRKAAPAAAPAAKRLTPMGAWQSTGKGVV